MSILDFIFPKRCVNCRKIGSYICTDCFAFIKFHDQGVCIVCQRPSIGGLTHPVCKGRYTPDGVFSSLVYKGVVKKLVYKFKYNPNLTDLKETLTDLFYEGIIQKEALNKVLEKDSVLVPIPLYKSKMRKRGYNQSLILARGLGKNLNIPVLDCLERVKDTKTQVGLTKEKREENIKGAFGLKINVILSGAKDLDSSTSSQNDMVKQVFLVDDVVTSGATLKEAAKALKKAGVTKVYGITLAHGQ
ncbi:MAG TPA: double zinc ribbon domain-containing protein [Candidatus Saccharimonadales bacterium]|nr:double zinc ribbon domain-containing protein [Candidatus Saccharimonadales bacterium]